MADQDIYHLSETEAELMIASKSDPNLWASYWLEKPGFPPFQFDYNFVEEGKWQVWAILAAQPLILVVAGIGTGKSLCMAALGPCFMACVTPDFTFANIGHELDQSKIGYDLILKYSRGTRFEKLITRKPASPHPKIAIEFYLGSFLFSSLLEFYSAGEDQSGENIFSKRFDWINIEEAFRFDNLATLRGRLRTRLTGSTPTGRSLMGRLSIISNPIDNPELWNIFDDAASKPDHAATFLIDTEMNKNVSEDQIKAQMEDIPEEERALYLKGARPEGRGSYYSKETVNRCASELLSVELKEGIAQGLPGYKGSFTGGLGYWEFRFPRLDGKIYIVVGDPGIGAAPARNAPTIQVWEVDPLTNLNIVRAFWWGNGHGSIMPYVNHFLEFLEIYTPEDAGSDSTGPQKNTTEVINLEYVNEKGYSVSRIRPLDFSNNKYAYLVSLRVTLEAGKLIWPDIATGIGSQLKSYDPVEDKVKSARIPQDIVSAMAMGARLSRANYPPRPAETDGKDNSDDGKPGRERLSVGNRSNRGFLRTESRR